MELALNKEYVNGTINFKNAQLKTATLEIANNLQKSKDAFVRAGLAMQKIIDDKLYEKDFFDADGKPSFSMYAEMVLGLSKTAAYRIVSVTRKLLYPEMGDKHTKPEYFKNFADSTLGVLANNKLGDYDGVKTFCDAYQITETTPRGDVEKYVKAYTRKENPAKTLEEYIEQEDTKEIDAETADTETTGAENENGEAETIPYTTLDLLYAQQAAHLVKALMTDFEYSTDLNKDEIAIFKEFVKRFAID